MSEITALRKEVRRLRKITQQQEAVIAKQRDVIELWREYTVTSLESSIQRGNYIRELKDALRVVSLLAPR